MPNPLSPRDRVALWFDSLLYASHHIFIVGQAGPRGQTQPMTRRELVEILRGRVAPIAQIPTSRSTNDRELYAEMLSLIRSWRTAINNRLNSNAANQEAVANGLVNNVMHPMFLALGCGDLCYDKERGCIECPPVLNV